MKRSKRTDVIVFNDQSGYFIFGNSNPAFVVVRQAIRGVMWGKTNISVTNWLKNLLLGHENRSIEAQHSGKSMQNSKVIIKTYERLNQKQKAVFIAGFSFGTSLRARFNIIEGFSGTGKINIIFALIVKVLVNDERILICSETNFAV